VLFRSPGVDAKKSIFSSIRLRIWADGGGMWN
jgi:hypothetical protein